MYSAVNADRHMAMFSRPTARNYFHKCHLQLRNASNLSPSIRAKRCVPSIFNTLAAFSTSSEVEDFGDYEIILPPEPHVFGVSHIIPRTVPSNILRPSYILDSPSRTLKDNGTTGGDGRIVLGSDDEHHLRRAARLARNVLEYAGSLVKVR